MASSTRPPRRTSRLAVGLTIFDGPEDVQPDGNVLVYVGDQGNDRVRAITVDAPVVDLTATEFSTIEGHGAAEVQVVLDEADGLDGTVDVVATGGSATPGPAAEGTEGGAGDFDPDPVTITIPAGETSGTGQVTVPDDDITRGQVVRMLYRLAGAPDVSTLPAPGLTDVPAWVQDTVRWAVARTDPVTGLDPIVTGYQDDRFRPDDPITRAQVTRMLLPFHRYVLVPPPPS